MPEALALLEPGAPRPPLDTLRLVASLPPRVLVVEGADDALAALARTPAVARLLRPGDPGEGFDGLGEGERLFVSAWLARAGAGGGGGAKARPGDGLPWDAPGFVPPDAPKGPR